MKRLGNGFAGYLREWLPAPLVYFRPDLPASTPVLTCSHWPASQVFNPSKIFLYGHRVTAGSPLTFDTCPDPFSIRKLGEWGLFYQQVKIELSLLGLLGPLDSFSATHVPYLLLIHLKPPITL